MYKVCCLPLEAACEITTDVLWSYFLLDVLLQALNQPKFISFGSSLILLAVDTFVFTF